ncbi:MAG: L-threonylcarbamoyladenylate synthase [Actinomycetes bacterium]
MSAPVPADAESVRLAAARLREGGVVALPTETVYGLAADASNRAAVERIFAIKGRPTDHPVIVHVLDADALDAWAVEIPDEARVLAASCWPGPLTLVLRRAPGVLDAVTGGLDTVAVRVPAHPVARAVLAEFGGAVAAPSANRFGRVSPTTAAAVADDLGDDVDLILDGGACRVGVESTIVDCSGGTVVVLRPGGAAVERISELLDRPIAVGGTTRAPGTLAAHYAPTARVVIVEDREAVAVATAHLAEGRSVALLAATVPMGLSDRVAVLEPPETDEEYARVLYDRLRTADHHRIEVVVAVPPNPVGIGRAVRDRLERAAASA